MAGIICDVCQTWSRFENTEGAKTVRCPSCGNFQSLEEMDEFTIHTVDPNAVKEVPVSPLLAFENPSDDPNTGGEFPVVKSNRVPVDHQADNPYRVTELMELRANPGENGSGLSYSDQGVARRKLGPPAMTMIVLHAIGLLQCCFLLFGFFLIVLDSQFEKLEFTTVGLTVFLAGIHGFCMFAFSRMLIGKNWIVCVAAIILSVIFGVTCFLIPTILAIWPIVILSNKKVRKLFAESI